MSLEASYQHLPGIPYHTPLQKAGSQVVGFTELQRKTVIKKILLTSWADPPFAAIDPTFSYSSPKGSSYVKRFPEPRKI